MNPLTFDNYKVYCIYHSYALRYPQVNGPDIISLA